MISLLVVCETSWKRNSEVADLESVMLSCKENLMGCFESLALSTGEKILQVTSNSELLFRNRNLNQGWCLFLFCGHTCLLRIFSWHCAQE